MHPIPPAALTSSPISTSTHSIPAAWYIATVRGQPDGIGGGAPFPVAVMVNHTRSLGGVDDLFDGDRVRQKRFEQAQSIAQKAQGFQTANPTPPLVLIGDYNGFQFTDGYVDVIGQIAGDLNPAENTLSGPDLVEPNLTRQVLSLPAK